MRESPTPEHDGDFFTRMRTWIARLGQSRRVFFWDWFQQLQESVSRREPPGWIVFFAIVSLMFFLFFWAIWLEGERQESIKEKTVTCEVDCTDEVNRAIAEYRTEVAHLKATIDAFTAGTPTHMPKPKGTPTLPPPEASGITPTSMTRGLTGTLPITITGSHFVAPPTVMLGTSPVVSLHVPSSTTLTCRVPYTMPPGVCGLTVANPDGQSDTLSPAFIVRESELTSRSPPLVTFGPDAERPYDQGGYQAQLIFFEVPSGTLSLSDTLYVRVFDADTGELSDVREGDNFDTTIRYTLYGLTGTYQVPEASAPRPPIAGLDSGSPLFTETVGVSPTLNLRWSPLLGPFSVAQGELVADRYLFKLAVEGVSGDDGNRYRVALSTLTDTNTVPGGVRMFAFSWTLAVTETDPPYLYPFVREGMTTFRQSNIGCNSNRGGRFLFRTPLRVLEARWSGADDKYMPADLAVWPDEDRATWTLDLSDYVVPVGGVDFLGFWAEDESGLPLHIFTRPTTERPP